MTRPLPFLLGLALGVAAFLRLLRGDVGTAGWLAVLAGVVLVVGARR